ncbi:MAG: hypothetical protein FD156_1189 [Nitrospirae bacterium]|nr:MAG: hypothetical protein FD156_1189 [Nitrospirota bacterium]
MGREYRRMTLKVKKKLASERQLANTDHHFCHVRQEHISDDVCVVEQVRKSKDCMAGIGCRHYGG